LGSRVLRPASSSTILTRSLGTSNSPTNLGMIESGTSMRGSQKWARCHSSLNFSPTRVKSGPIRRVEKRCGTSNAYSPAWLTGPQRRVSPVTGRTNCEWQYQQPSRM
jgi:hypothetical protein